MNGWDMFVAEVGTELNALGWSNVTQCLRSLEFGYTAKDELTDRLNARLRGEDPGKPTKWRGLE